MFSKATAFTEIVTCTQIAWHFVQTLARPIKGLPSAPIELHTAARVVCTIRLYLIWLQKPYSIDSRLAFKEQPLVDMTALLLTSNEADRKREIQIIFINHDIGIEAIIDVHSGSIMRTDALNPKVGTASTPRSKRPQQYLRFRHPHHHRGTNSNGQKVVGFTERNA